MNQRDTPTATGPSASALAALSPDVRAKIQSGQLQVAFRPDGSFDNLYTTNADGTQNIYGKNGVYVRTQQPPASEGALGLGGLLTAARNLPGDFSSSGGLAALAAAAAIAGTGGAFSDFGGLSSIDLAGRGAEGILPSAAAGGGPELATQFAGPGLSIPAAGGGTLTAAGVTGAGAGAGAGAGSGLLSTLASNARWLGPAASAVGSLINGNAAVGAANTQADAQLRAAQIAADAAKFRPVGITTGFGKSNFGYDANGNVNSAGYTLTPEMQAQRDALIKASGGMLTQFTGSQAATAPMADAAKRAMALGNGYLTADPMAQAAKFLADQQGLLAPSRASTMADLQATLQAQGRSGFAIGGGVNGMGAANPQLQALLNAQLQQDNSLAASATQGGMDYAKFGAGMVGTGGDLLSSMYGVQSKAFDPYKTALGGASTVEGLGQNALTMGMDLGSALTAANSRSGSLLANGVNDAASTMAPANAYSPWGSLLTGAGNSLQNYKWGT